MSLFKRLSLKVLVIVILAVKFGGTENKVKMTISLVNSTEMDKINEIVNALNDKVHRLENITLQRHETNEKLNDLADKVGSVASVDTKMNALEGKLNELEATVHTNMSTLLRQAENVTMQIKETNEKLNDLADKVEATVTTNMSTLLHQAENVTLQIKETKVKLNDLADKFASVDTRMNSFESKFNDLTSTVTKFVGDIKESLLKPLTSCVDAFARPLLNHGSGIYDIQLAGNSSPFNVYCMADPNGGQPWTVVQRRVDATVDFYRNWTEYQRGFGDLEGNFFIGLDKLHSCTTKGDPQELWVMLTDPDGMSAHAYYDAFAIGNATEKYPLMVLGKYSGDAGDSLSYHKSMKFSTFDNDNDKNNAANCAEYFKSAWWFNKCHYCQLNGLYGSTKQGEGLNWNTFRNPPVTMKYAHMAIRPARK